MHVQGTGEVVLTCVSLTRLTTALCHSRSTTVPVPRTTPSLPTIALAMVSTLSLILVTFSAF
jgi:hypothetical protein